MSQYFQRCLTNGTNVCYRQIEAPSHTFDVPTTSQPAQQPVLKKTSSVKRTSMAVATEKQTSTLSDENITPSSSKKPKKTVKLTND